MRRGVLLTIVAAALTAAGPAGAEKGFNDPAGDSGASHDITTLTVSHDSTQVVWRFPVPNPFPNLRPPEDQAWLLSIDVDRNPSTGDGGEEVRVLERGGASVFVWNGRDWVDAPPDGISVRWEISSSSAEWRVQLPRGLLSNTGGFDFRLMFAKFVGDNVGASDLAPDAGSWRYELVVAGKGTARLARVTVSPGKARPGGSVLVRARAQLAETGEPVATGGVVCTVRSGTTTKRVTGRIAAGLATCRLTAPRVSRPTTVRGTMTIAGSTQSLPFSFRAG